MSKQIRKATALHEDVFDRETTFPPIVALRTALLAERLRSFTRVADELGMTQSGVSRTISGLEKMTGRRLFVRSRGGVRPTRVGEIYLESVRQILSDLGAATMRVQTDGEDLRRIHVATLPSFGGLWLAPRISGFLARNPGVSVSVTSSIGAIDLSNSSVDCVIHYGTEAWSEDARCEFMMHETLVPYAAPALLDRLGVTPNVAALEHMTLIHHSHRPSAWRDWHAEIGRSYPETRQKVQFEQYQ
ncbi:MAG: LysR family transcriptional regulator, partial [Rhodospirillaceae bacterium]